MMLIERGLVSAQSLICHIHGNTFDDFNLLQDLCIISRVRDEALIIADAWIPKQLEMRSISVSLDSLK